MNNKTKEKNYDVAVKHYNNGNTKLAKIFSNKHLKREPNSIPALKLLAFIEYQSNHFEKALYHLENIVKLDEDISEINNLIGSIFLKTGNYSQSIEFFNKSIDNDENAIDAYINLINALSLDGRSTQAIEICKRAFALDPTSTSVLKQFAELSLKVGDVESAHHLYQSWLKIAPVSLTANRGTAKCHLMRNDPESVLDQLNTLKKTTDRSPDIRLDVCNEFLNFNEFEKAITSYKDILDDTSSKEAIYNNIASAYDHLNNPEDAVRYFLKAIDENKNYVAAYSNIGRVYTDICSFEEAEIFLSQALKLNPNNVNAIINMGRLQEVKNEFILAKKHFEKALSIEPNNTKALCNLGNMLQQLGSFDESKSYYKKCLSIDPNYGDAEQNLGINELTTGDFTTAWGHYFKRTRHIGSGEKLSTITPGMNLSGKRVYFCRSQGIGDEIFFLRFLPKLRKQNLNITYRASKMLYPILAGTSEIDCLLDEDDEIPICDYYFTIDDLPLILNIDSINKIAPTLLLKASPEKILEFKNLLTHYPPPYTAITWRAGTQEVKENIKNNSRDLSKIFPIKHFKEITSTLKGSIIILQRNPDESEIEELKNVVSLPIINYSKYNNSLEDILAILEHIDEYISVSNTNIHLLAALGKTAKILVPFPPEWRWMSKDAPSPWFPDFGTYRQDSNGSWDTAIKRLSQVL